MYQKEKFTNDIINRISEENQCLEGAKVAVWGLTFKPETDDIRNAPSIYIINKLLSKGAVVNAMDPKASKKKVDNIFDHNNFSLIDNQYDILQGADCLLLLTEWREFRSPDFDKIKSLMKSLIIFDGRNLYNRVELEALGFELHQI